MLVSKLIKVHFILPLLLHFFVVSAWQHSKTSITIIESYQLFAKTPQMATSKTPHLFNPCVWVLIVALSIALFFLLYPLFLDIGSEGNFSCFNFNRYKETKKKSEPYRLFGTKTTYLNAREAIRDVFKTQWPLEANKCSPTYLFFLNRHSIRYPSVKEIRKFRKFLPGLREDLIAGGKLNPTVFKELFNWRLLMNEVDENRVSLSGKYETAITAQIFYRYFPSLLDIGKVNFEVGVTPKIRTTETANAFVRSLVELQVKQNFTSFNESNNLVQDIMQKKFPNKENEILMTHKKCKKLMEERNNPPPKHPKEYDQFAQTEAFANLLTSFSIRNGLKYTVTFDTLVIMYRACSYEMAIHRFSPWCHLFTDSELIVLDYLMDISEYFDAYGTPAHRQLACSVVSDLYAKLESVIKQPEDAQKNATLYFSHENLLSKVMSFFDIFNHFPPHDNSTEQKLCLPKDRQWRSSLAVPFGTNFAAVLYRCGRDNSTAQSKHKLLTLLNEIPVKIRGCSSELCDVEHFFKEYETATKTCDLDKICK